MKINNNVVGLHMKINHNVSYICSLAYARTKINNNVVGLHMKINHNVSYICSLAYT